jgi:hypothetical protein
MPSSLGILANSATSGNWSGHETIDLREFRPLIAPFGTFSNLLLRFTMLKLRRRSHCLASSIRASALALALFATGCTQSQRQTIMGEGFNDEFAKSGDKLRTSSNGGEYDGLSTKSRQIENDLGVR